MRQRPRSSGATPLSRRAALAASVSAVVAGAALGTAVRGSATPPSITALPENALITLGVQAGPPPVPNKTGISSTLKVGPDLYQIDCGLGSLNAFTNAGLRFDALKSLFITHLHTDHIVDYYSFFLSGGYTASARQGAGDGLRSRAAGDCHRARSAMRIHRPWTRAIPHPGWPPPPMPFVTAFAYTSNIFIRDMGIDDIGDLMRVTEIAVPPGSDHLNRAP